MFKHFLRSQAFRFSLTGEHRFAYGLAEDAGKIGEQLKNKQNALKDNPEKLQELGEIKELARKAMRETQKGTEKQNLFRLQTNIFLDKEGVKINGNKDAKVLKAMLEPQYIKVLVDKAEWNVLESATKYFQDNKTDLLGKPDAPGRMKKHLDEFLNDPAGKLEAFRRALNGEVDEGYPQLKTSDAANILVMLVDAEWITPDQKKEADAKLAPKTKPVAEKKETAEKPVDIDTYLRGKQDLLKDAELSKAFEAFKKEPAKQFIAFRDALNAKLSTLPEQRVISFLTPQTLIDSLYSAKWIVRASERDAMLQKVAPPPAKPEAPNQNELEQRRFDLLTDNQQKSYLQKIARDGKNSIMGTPQWERAADAFVRYKILSLAQLWEPKDFTREMSYFGVRINSLNNVRNLLVPILDRDVIVDRPTLANAMKDMDSNFFPGDRKIREEQYKPRGTNVPRNVPGGVPQQQNRAPSAPSYVPPRQTNVQPPVGGGYVGIGMPENLPTIPSSPGETTPPPRQKTATDRYLEKGIIDSEGARRVEQDMSQLERTMTAKDRYTVVVPVDRSDAYNAGTTIMIWSKNKGFPYRLHYSVSRGQWSGDTDASIAKQYGIWVGRETGTTREGRDYNSGITIHFTRNEPYIIQKTGTGTPFYQDVELERNRLKTVESTKIAEVKRYAENKWNFNLTNAVKNEDGQKFGYYYEHSAEDDVVYSVDPSLKHFSLWNTETNTWEKIEDPQAVVSDDVRAKLQVKEYAKEKTLPKKMRTMKQAPQVPASTDAGGSEAIAEQGENATLSRLRMLTAELQAQLQQSIHGQTTSDAMDRNLNFDWTRTKQIVDEMNALFDRSEQLSAQDLQGARDLLRNMQEYNAKVPAQAQMPRMTARMQEFIDKSTPAKPKLESAKEEFAGEPISAMNKVLEKLDALQRASKDAEGKPDHAEKVKAERDFVMSLFKNKQFKFIFNALDANDAELLPNLLAQQGLPSDKNFIERLKNAFPKGYSVRLGKTI